MGYIFLIMIIAALLVIVSNIRIVPQAYAFIVERLGAYDSTWSVGMHMKTPFIDKIANIVLLKERVVDFKPQPVITKDNVTMQIDTVIYLQVTDPKLFTYGVEDPMSAIENLTATTLRNIIGDMELDETLTSRDTINTQMRAILDEATDPWGIKVNRVELKNILPPREIRDAMERQMKAERERRESVTRAEAEKRSQVLVAEGKKQAEITLAEGAKQAAILEAQARQETQVLIAEGEAQAILKVQHATAEAIKYLNASDPSEAVLAMRSMDAFAKAADGQATKIIIPSNIQGVAGLATSIKELVNGKE